MELRRVCEPYRALAAAGGWTRGANMWHGALPTLGSGERVAAAGVAGAEERGGEAIAADSVSMARRRANVARYGLCAMAPAL